MMTPPASRDLVLVGGGHSHALALRMLAMKPVPDTRITLVSPESLTPYSGMLPGWVAGHYSLEASHIDLARLCQWAGVRFVRDRVTGIDPHQRRLQLAASPALHYDRASLDLGATPSLDAVPGVREHAVPVKPVSSFRHRWHRLLNQLRPGDQPRIVVAGAGAGGTEMALALAHALIRRGIQGRIQLLDAATLLPNFPARTRRFLYQQLHAYDIALHEHQSIQQVEANRLTTPDGGWPFDWLLWCTGAAGAPWLRDSPLPTTDAGLVRIDRQLRVLNHDGLFAAGDCAWLEDHALPRSGVHAVRQAPVLARNLRVERDRDLRPYRPQSATLSLLSAGTTRATGNRGTQWLPAGWLWRIKNHIDLRFMARFQQLPERRMPPSEHNEDEPRCAGCGSKIGGAALREALAALQPLRNPDITTGLEHGEDAAVIDWPRHQPLVQTQDYFPAFIDEPWLFGRIAALHALSDAWAMHARPHSALATITVPTHHPRLQARDLTRLLAGAVHELNRAGCSLAGGHSLEGPLTGAGFTINATATDDPLLRKEGARAGDSLIVTKGLGTGVLLAGLMRNQCRGPWLDAALASMLRSNATAASVLAQHGARACTDITGFGLLGHLHELCSASRVGAEVQAGDVPLLEGAMALAREGVASTLAPANQAVLVQCEPDEALRDHPLLTLLTDPQTNGGLLASVPAEQAPDCLAELQDQGLQAAQVGRILEESAGLQLRS